MNHTKKVGKVSKKLLAPIFAIGEKVQRRSIGEVELIRMGKFGIQYKMVGVNVYYAESELMKLEETL